MEKPWWWHDRINPPRSSCEGCIYEDDCYELRVFYGYDDVPCFKDNYEELPPDENTPKSWWEKRKRDEEENGADE